MSVTVGRITAQLADPIETIPSELIDLIHKNIRPPTPIGAEDVYVRAMFVVSDQVNSFGGRFPSDEHEHLATLLIDSPVMVGHRKDKLPVGRNFHALTLVRNGENWVKSYFYWLKSAEGAANLRENIDGGIYKECSIGFMYHLPECSICGQDIRRCKHEPLQEYRQGGKVVVCHFNYRQIERVLETSLVYRGALPDTEVSGDLMRGKEDLEMPDTRGHGKRLTPITDLSLLDQTRRYLVVPRYKGVPVTVTMHDGEIVLKRRDGSTIDHVVTEQYRESGLEEGKEAYALLVGYRGKRRSSRDQVEQYLAGDETSVSRLVLMLYPTGENDHGLSSGSASGLFVRMIPHRITDLNGLHRSALEIKTLDGVEVWPAGSSPSRACGYLYRPPTTLSEPEGYVIAVHRKLDKALLIIRHKSVRTCFEVNGLDIGRLLNGGRYVAQKRNGPLPSLTSQYKTLRTGHITELDVDGDGLRLNAGGENGEVLVLKPIILGAQKQYLFSRHSA